MNALMMRRRALMSTAKKSVIDTSATIAAFYVCKSNLERTVCGARLSGNVKLWRDGNTSTAVFSAANYTSRGLNSTNFYTPWEDSFTGSRRCKFGGPNTNPSTSPTDVTLNDAFAFWKETGRIMFAGPDTPFYGMANIDGTLAQPGWTG